MSDDTDTVWTTLDGRKFLVRDMAANHIQSCLRMLRTSQESVMNFIPRRAWITVFEAELQRREKENDSAKGSDV